MFKQSSKFILTLFVFFCKLKCSLCSLGDSFPYYRTCVSECSRSICDEGMYSVSTFYNVRSRLYYLSMSSYAKESSCRANATCLFHLMFLWSLNTEYFNDTSQADEEWWLHIVTSWRHTASGPFRVHPDCLAKHVPSACHSLYNGGSTRNVTTFLYPPWIYLQTAVHFSQNLTCLPNRIENDRNLS